MNSQLLSALVDGAVAVTPNRRLSRFLRREFDLARHAMGLTVWPTPTILPFNAWLQTLWEQARAQDRPNAGALLLSPAQAALQWQVVVDSDERTLLDPRGAAALAADAWGLLHAWGAGGESWRAWRAGADTRDDAATFADWAEAYLARLRSADALDLALLPDIVARTCIADGVGCPPIVLAGFVELTPQQERLFAALRETGVDVMRCDSLPARTAAPSRTTALTARDEIIAALTWAREHASRNPGAQVGVVVEDLAQRRDAVLALAEDILCPTRILPGGARASVPFEISLGTTLAALPLTSAALHLIALAGSRLPIEDAAVLVRSPYLPGADAAWPQRAAIERDWLDEGRLDVDLGDVIDALQRRSPDLAARFRGARGAVASARSVSPRDWVDAWRVWLAAAGWPGTRPLSSEEFQAREAWERLLTQVATLGAVSPRLTRAQALAALRGAAAESVFQPEGSVVPIQILGVLEASGVAFDAMWVAGFSSERWPPPPSPNPLLPIAWQRDRGVPRASAQRELAYAQTLTEHFARAAPEVVFSSAATVDDHPVSPSALVLEYPERPLPAAAPSWISVIAASAAMESVTDARAPALPRGSTVPGGSSVIATQSDCPFRAVARHRLDADRWQTPLFGLSPSEHGSMVHASLAAFWGAVANHATLDGLSPERLSTIIDRASEAGRSVISAARWQLLPHAVRSGQMRRLRLLLAAWLDVERKRPPFTVRDRERSSVLELAQLTFRIRPDRVDALADGGVAIIDYKTGGADRPRQWFDERPRSVQLGLYTLVQRVEQPAIPVRAAAYAQMRHDAIEAFGVAADASAWPGLVAVEDVGPFANWPALEQWWRIRLEELATEIANGHATVTPRESPLPCRNCGMQMFCRIESVRMQNDDDGPGAATDDDLSDPVSD